MTEIHEQLQATTARIRARSADQRGAYLEDMDRAMREKPARGDLACSNLAHVFAASGEDKAPLKGLTWPNLGVVTAYNDMLSAHQPFAGYPDIIKNEARNARATAQVAGGTPAMCDGVTQGRAGMELSLFSREVIALSTAIALSHESYDGALLLGVCDKIVPGLFMGAARFGHMPILFVPAGPMPSGIGNPEKAKVRKRFAAGEASREELLEAEAASYHAPGTCTFYGTANSNQMAMEAMGLHVPGAAFVPPNTPLREALTRAAVRCAIGATAQGGAYLPFAAVVDERSFVNAIAALMATGGSTNHALHLVAMARAVGLVIDWDDFAAISSITPLVARIYPNGAADVNHFQAAGGVGFVLRDLMDAGLMYPDARTANGGILRDAAREPALVDGALTWREPPAASLDRSVLRNAADPFAGEGGLRLVQGNLGRAVVKTSAVPAGRTAILAPARVFEDQAAVERAFQSGALDGQDFVAVVSHQGPRANGMPELHKLTPPLAVLQDRGARVALLTDGRMSGASGAVLAAIHVTPEAECGGAIARIRDGDLIEIDAERGVMNAKVENLEARTLAVRAAARHAGVGRELFSLFRANALPAELGGGALL